MRLNSRGISLVEVMIMVILISTLATAYWNYHIVYMDLPQLESRYASLDSIADGVLEEITGRLRYASTEKGTGQLPISIEHSDTTDMIKVRHNGANYIYYVDKYNNLVRQTETERGLLLEDVVSLKASCMGSQTMIVTISVIPTNGEYDESEAGPRSYSKVVTLNSLLQ